MNRNSLPRRVARRLGVGRTILRTKLTLHTGPATVLRCELLLRSIEGLRPLPCSDQGLEVHMLLNHPRVLDGLWAYASLARFAASRLVIHDDGSLSERDVCLFLAKFPGCSVIRRSEADAAVCRQLDARRLPLCKKMRNTNTFGLKLIDVVLLGTQSHALLLDSDVLFFAPPHEITRQQSKGAHERKSLYMKDTASVYSLRLDEMAGLSGVAPIGAFNAGLAFVAAKSVDLGRMERYLQHLSFWDPRGVAEKNAEQTLWAMEMSTDGASALPATYAIAPMKPGINGLICCHYCGGLLQQHLFHTDGVPHVAAGLRRAGLLP